MTGGVQELLGIRLGPGRHGGQSSLRWIRRRGRRGYRKMGWFVDRMLPERTGGRKMNPGIGMGGWCSVDYTEPFRRDRRERSHSAPSGRGETGVEPIP